MAKTDELVKKILAKSKDKEEDYKKVNEALKNITKKKQKGRLTE